MFCYLQERLRCFFHFLFGNNLPRCNSVTRFFTFVFYIKNVFDFVDIFEAFGTIFCFKSKRYSKTGM